MQLSTHYYVLSFNEQICRLYEGFRDTLIDIQNGDFPIESQTLPNPVESKLQDFSLQEYFVDVDKRFSHYYEQDPLRLILAGTADHQALFRSVSAYKETVIGAVALDGKTTEPDELGKQVWAVVKQVLAGANKKTIQDLLAARDANKIVVGIEAIGQQADFSMGSTLFVEEDYHVKGRFREFDHSLNISEEVDIREINDDAVDLVVENVLGMGGKVVFLDGGALGSFQKMAMILNR
jgi:hypothetical protein